MPRVSLILPVKNGAAHLRESIASLVSQSFHDFELLVIDDGSTDESVDIAESFSDPRVIVAKNPSSGLVSALNFGLSLGTGEFVARQDADDVSLLNRLETQLNYFAQHPNVGLVGTAVRTFGAAKRLIRYPSTTTPIRARMLFSNPFAHPTVMFRREVLPNGNQSYEKDFPVAEDYRLWTVISRDTKMANISQPLVRYRIHGGQASERGEAARLSSVQTILRNQFSFYGFEVTESELNLHLEISTNPFFLARNLGRYHRVNSWLRFIASAPEFSMLNANNELRREISFQMRRLIRYGALSPVKWLKTRLGRGDL
jgi:glycosyltransferase involved in cell wall biosynthesis